MYIEYLRQQMCLCMNTNTSDLKPILKTKNLGFCL